LANLVVGWNPGHFDESIAFPPPDKLTIQCLGSGAIIYVVSWTPVIDYFFDAIYPLISEPFVLVTGESDDPTPLPHHQRFLDASDSKIIQWFAQNVRHSALSDVARTRMTPVPINHNCFYSGTLLLKF
jgi:hypothetical protein